MSSAVNWPRVQDCRHILVLRLGALGDVADAAPAVARLREAAPKAHLAWMVKRPFAPLVEPWCDEVIPFEGWRGWASLMKSLCLRPWDLAVDFHGNQRSALLTRLSGAQFKVGYAPRLCREGAENAYTHHLDPAVALRLDQGLALAAALQARGDYLQPDFPQHAAEAALAQELMSDGHDIVLVAGTSPKGEHKRWPVERWRKFLQLSPSRRYLMVGSNQEADFLRQVARGFGDRLCVAPGTSLRTLIEVLRRAQAVIGVDTGPLHLAHLLGRPTLVLFGPKDPGVYGPRYNNHRVLWNRQPCAPCRNWSCLHVSCMWSLGAGEVARVAEELYGNK